LKLESSTTQGQIIATINAARTVALPVVVAGTALIAQRLPASPSPPERARL